MPSDYFGEEPRIARFDVIEDSQLVDRAKAGDAEAFGELVRKYQMDVRTFLHRRIRDGATVDDLAQEVFMGALGSINQLNQSHSVRSWLLSIARFKLIDFFRRQSRQKTENSLGEVLDQEQLRRCQGSTADHDLEHESITKTLQACLALLQPQARGLIEKYYFQKTTAREIAALSQQKPSTVRMALLRVRRALAKCIRKRLGESVEL